MLFLIVHIAMLFLVGFTSHMRAMITGRIPQRERAMSSGFTRRKLDRRRHRHGGGRIGPRRRDSFRRPLRADTARSRRHSGHRKDADLRLAPAAHVGQSLAREFTAQRHLQGPPGERAAARERRCIATGSPTGFDGWQPDRRRTGGAADVVLARRAEALAGGNPHHPARLRGRLVLHRRMDRRAALASARSGRERVPEARYVVFMPYREFQQRRFARVVEQHRHGGRASSANACSPTA